MVKKIYMQPLHIPASNRSTMAVWETMKIIVQPKWATPRFESGMYGLYNGRGLQVTVENHKGMHIL